MIFGRRGAFTRTLWWPPRLVGTPGSGPRGEKARAFGRKPHGQSLRRNARKPLVPSSPRPGPIRHLNNFCSRSLRFWCAIVGTSHARSGPRAPLGGPAKPAKPALPALFSALITPCLRGGLCQVRAQGAPGRTRGTRSSGSFPALITPCLRGAPAGCQHERFQEWRGTSRTKIIQVTDRPRPRERMHQRLPCVPPEGLTAGFAAKRASLSAPTGATWHSQKLIPRPFPHGHAGPSWRAPALLAAAAPCPGAAWVV